MKSEKTAAEVKPGQLIWVMVHRSIRKVRVTKITPTFVYFRYYKQALHGFIESKIRREVVRRQCSLPKLNFW